MKVSVIIPYQNEKIYINDCLDSMEEQTSREFEVIVVCDHSSEEALAALREREKQVSFPLTIVELTDGSGVAAARNAGIRASQGEFILFLDCDDFLEKTAVEFLLHRSEGQDIVYGRKRWTWYSRKTYYENRQKKEELNDTDPESEDEGEGEGESQIDRAMPEVRESDSEWVKVFCHLIRSNDAITGVSVLGLLFRREFILANDLFFGEDYKYYPDIAYVIRAMCKTEKVFEVRKVLYHKRHHNDPINLPALSQVSDDKTKVLEIMKAYLDIKGDMKGHDERAEISVDGKFIKYYVKKIARFYVTADRKDAQEVYETASGCLPLIRKEAKKKAMLYSRRLMRRSMKKDTEAIAAMVRKHSALQTFRRVVTKRSQCKKYLYRKVFTKRKVQEDLVILETFFGRNYSDSPKYIFEYMNREFPGKYKYVWVLNKKEKLPYPATQVKRFSLRYFYYMAVAKYFVFNVRQPKYIQKREGTVFLETWHGTPLKKLAFDMEDNTSASPLYKRDIYIQSRSWDYLIAPNQFSLDVFRSCFMYDGEMLKTGYPRNDILHLDDRHQAELTSEIKQELGIPEDKKVILYAPTWRDDEFYDHGQYKFTLQLDLEMLKRELGDEYVVLLRTHYFIVDSLDLTAFAGFAFNGSTYNDIARLYLISDILITDYSSVFFDYANLKRPMLFFTYDLEKYRDILHGFYIDMEENLPGPMLFTTEEIVDAIRNLPELEEKYREKYDVFYETYCGWEDGNASQKVVEAVFGK